MAEIRSKRQIKQEAKNRLEQIKQSLKRIQKTHLGVWGLSCLYWLIMVIICQKELNCRGHWHKINDILAKDRYSDATLTYHKSIEVEYAEELENEHIETLRKNNCITKQNQTFYAITVNSEEKWVLGSVLDIPVELTDGSSIEAADPKYENNLNTDLTSIAYNNATYTYTESSVTVKYTLGDETELCNMCIPLPFKGTEQPIALEWYSPLRWWDMFMLTVAGVIQFRLKSIEDGDGYGSYGPLVVDEKDIAMTSIQILTIIMSTAFYSVELTMSSLWLTLHSNNALEREEHTSYFTVLERNELLAITNSIWIFCMIPMFVISYKIKLQIQKYEQNQFLTEL